ncbi:MAG: hypothetical protein BRD53_03305 [Bacteroidetes bacterium SW_7_64_58]|nr:MAG: hypothetical protein BRD53_03305 [Bacteroidetes bacterium SW_7_64_58]
MDGRRMGATPLTDTVEGLAARLRMQRAGYRPVDTTMAQLEGKQQAELAVSLTPQATSSRASGGGGQRRGTEDLYWAVNDHHAPAEF